MCTSTICCDNDSNKAKKLENEIGIISGHAYTLIAALHATINGKK